MATLSSVRTSFARSLNLMRCVVLGSRHLRLCHNDSKNSDSNSDAIHVDNAEKVDDEESDNYSFHDDDEGIDDDSISDRILTAALQFVPEHGWSAEAIAEGAKIEGFSGMAAGMFPREGGDLALHFIDNCNLKLGDYLADNSRTEEENRKIGQTDFIKDALEVRLKMIIPYIESWPQAMGLMLYPSNAPDALQCVANMTDDIWYHSNDSSTNINWYLKRTCLATIYGLTEDQFILEGVKDDFINSQAVPLETLNTLENKRHVFKLYMVQDRSDDFEETWRFLDRRFQDIRNTGNMKNSFNKAGEDITSLACSTLTLVRNVTGFNKWDR